MNATPQFAELVSQARNGSQSAAEELVSVYGREILRAVRRRLRRELRVRFDSHDFVQAVWASFFSQLGEIESIGDPQALARYLLRMAENKVVSENRRSLYSSKRNIRRETSLSDGQLENSAPICSEEPTPSETAISDETWKQITSGCSARDLEILKLRLSGHTFIEIAETLGFDERTIRRVIERRLKSFRSA